MDSPFSPPPNLGYCTTWLLRHQTGPLAQSLIGHISNRERQQLQSRPSRWGLSSSWGLPTIKGDIGTSQLLRPNTQYMLQKSCPKNFPEGKTTGKTTGKWREMMGKRWGQPCLDLDPVFGEEGNDGGQRRGGNDEGQWRGQQQVVFLPLIIVSISLKIAFFSNISIFSSKYFNYRGRNDIVYPFASPEIVTFGYFQSNLTLVTRAKLDRVT